MNQYEVLPGKQITGLHKVYREGETFSDREACGDMVFAVKEKIVKKVGEKSRKTEPKSDGDGSGSSGDTE